MPPPDGQAHNARDSRAVYAPGTVVRALVTHEYRSKRERILLRLATPPTLDDALMWVAHQDVADATFFADGNLDVVEVIYAPVE